MARRISQVSAENPTAREPFELERSTGADWKPWVGLLARLGLAAVWIFAASTKFDLAETTRSVRNYRIGWPDGMNVLIGHSLPFLEMGLGILLLLGLFTRLSATVTAVMMIAFIIGIASAWYRGLAIDCGCFGTGGTVAPDQTQYPKRIAEDIGFLLMAAWLIRFPRTKFSADRGLGLVAP